MGHTHAVTGMAAGAATLPLLPTDNVVAQLCWVAVASGWALWPDIDHPHATATKMWGPVTRVLHLVIAWLAKGHRVGTHDPILAPLVFGGLVFAGSLHPYTAGIPIAVTIGLALRALSWLIPGNNERTWWINLVASLLGGWWITTQAPGSMWWLPVAAALGILVAIAGDALTKQGIIIPFTWLTPGPERRIPGGPITTGGAAEIVVVVAAYAATAYCLYANVSGLQALIQPISATVLG